MSTIFIKSVTTTKRESVILLRNENYEWYNK